MSGDVLPRILIVDDEPEITAILSDLFYGKYDCTTAGSAEEALGRLAGTNYAFELCESRWKSLLQLQNR